MSAPASAAVAFLFDLDGTLIDSVYQHVLAWREATQAAGIELPVWRIHRQIGMSGGLMLNALLREKKVQGCSMGSNRFKVDMPRYVELYRQGRLKLDEMITRRGRLQDVNEAFRAMKAGEVARTVLMFD